jgi:hypothetical protein
MPDVPNHHAPYMGHSKEASVLAGHLGGLLNQAWGSAAACRDEARSSEQAEAHISSSFLLLRKKAGQPVIDKRISPRVTPDCLLTTPLGALQRPTAHGSGGL